MSNEYTLYHFNCQAAAQADLNLKTISLKIKVAYIFFLKSLKCGNNSKLCLYVSYVFTEIYSPPLTRPLCILICVLQVYVKYL